MNANTKSIEEGRKEFEIVLQRYIDAKLGDISEQDTLTKFIHPALEAFGWDILDFNEVREEVFVKTEGKENHIDIVLYSEAKPYIGMEIKKIPFGNILDRASDNVKESVAYLLEDLSRKSRKLNVKYAVLTRFKETLVVEPNTMATVATFRSQQEHLEKFQVLWKILSKPSV
jgi:hypothetical protein